MAVWLVVYGLVLSRRVIVAYRRAVRIFDDTHADDIGAYIKWLSVFTYRAVIFGVGCGLFTFLPDEYVYIWILSSIPFYVYLYHCYQNYPLFYEQVENAMEICFRLTAPICLSISKRRMVHKENSGCTPVKWRKTEAE